MPEHVVESVYYTVEFQAGSGSNLWLTAANDESTEELTEEQARYIADRQQELGLGVRVYLHTKRETVQLVMLKVAG